jgi:hypothetical protein
MPQRNDRGPGVLYIGPRTFGLLVAAFCGGFIVFLSAVNYVTTSLESETGAPANLVVAPAPAMSAASSPRPVVSFAPMARMRGDGAKVSPPVKRASPCPPPVARPAAVAAPHPTIVPRKPTQRSAPALPVRASALPAKPAQASTLPATPVPLVVPLKDAASLTPAHGLDPRGGLLVPSTSAATPPDSTLAPKPR